LRLTNTNTGVEWDDGLQIGNPSTGSLSAVVWNRENGYLGFATNNTERVRITSTGDVGIGDMSPDEKLHVVGNIKMVDGNQGAGKVLTSDASGVGSWSTVTGIGGSGTANYIPKFTAGTTIGNSLIYDDGSYVGIGIASPSANLHLHGEAAIRITNTNTGTDWDDGIQIGHWTNGSLHATFWNRNNGFLSIGTNNAERMRIAADGKVGVGTSSPQRTFHVDDVMRLEPRTAAPSSPSDGDLYVNSTTDHIYCYLNGAWRQLDN
jgi:hypothetical protein